jgi:hypothetical protein
MQLKELEDFKLSDAVRFHDSLNPVIWQDEHLRPEVRKQLLVIAQDFVDYLGIPDLDIKDITLSGSNAAYTYTPHSDIDLHILVDIKQLRDDDVYRELFTSKKLLYNDKHDIKIHGYDVELYVQDSAQPVKSLGEYSVLKDRWIKIPTKRRSKFDEQSTQQKFMKLVQLSELALRSHDRETVESLLSTIRKYRQAGLDEHGEFGPENLAFKILRSRGIVDQLYKHLDNLHSEKLSLPEDDVLDKPTLTPQQLAKKHSVPLEDIFDQLLKGINIELEHTNDESVAREIALDHLSEDPNYYTKLKKANLEEDKYDDLPERVYHVTPSENLDSIMSKGLLPQIGDRTRKIVDEKPAIYCFPDKNAMEDAMMNWLGDEFDEDEALALLEIYTAGLKGQVTEGAEYEVAITSAIPPQNIRIISRDLDTPISESSGYIPSRKERNDPRFKTGLTVDVNPDSIKQNAKKLGLGSIHRSGVPQTMKYNGKVT